MSNATDQALHAPAKKRRIRTQTAVVEALSVKNLIEVFLRRFWLIPTPLLLIPLLAFGASFLIRPSYLSTTTIALGKSEILNPLVRFDTAVSLTNQNRLNLFRKIVYSRPLIEQVISRLGLDGDVRTQQDMERRIDDIRTSLRLMDLDGDSFQIGCSMHDPVLARDVVKTVSDLFIETSLGGSRREAEAAVKFIGEQMEVYDGKLRRSESRLEEFKTANIMVMQRMDKLGTQLDAVRDRKNKATLDLESAKLKIKLTEEQFASMSPMIIEKQVYKRENIFRARKMALELQLANLKATRLEGDRDVAALEREMEEVSRLADEDEKQTLASETSKTRSPEYDQTKSRLEELRVNASVLENELSMHQEQEAKILEELKKVPDIERQREMLVADVQTNRELYNTLKVKYEHARISQEVEQVAQANRFSIIEPPLVPLQRYKPKRVLFAVGGVLGGLLVSVCFVLFVEWFDARVLRMGELVHRFDIGVAGSLSTLNRPSRRWLPGRSLLTGRRIEVPEALAPGFILSAEGLSVIPEQRSRHTRTAVDMARELRGILIALQTAEGAVESSTVLGITSPGAGEGKTLLAANLAVLAASDRRDKVLLVDASIERPGLSRHYGLAGDPGLVDVLAGKRDLRDIIRPSGVPGLDILPAGQATGDDRLMVASVRMQRVLEAVRRHYPLVVLDLPPVMQNPESRSMIYACDVSLMAVRLNGTRMSSVHAAVEKIGAEHISAFLVNGQEHWIPDWLYRLV